MRTKVNLSDLESNQEKPDFSNGGRIQSKPILIKEDGIVTLENGEIMQKFSINKNYTPTKTYKNNRVREGLLIISQIKKEFEYEYVGSHEKFSNDLKLFNTEYTTSNSERFVLKEIARTETISINIENNISDYCWDFKAYVYLRDYIQYLKAKNIYKAKIKYKAIGSSRYKNRTKTLFKGQVTIYCNYIETTDEIIKRARDIVLIRKNIDLDDYLIIYSVKKKAIL